MKKLLLSPKFLFTLLILFVTGFFSYLFAQSQFITPIVPLSLTQKQNNIKEKVLNNSFYKKMEFIQMGNLPTLQKNGVLKFLIPGRPGQIEAYATRVKSFSSTNYEWYGKINGGLGTMIVLNKNGKISASIYLPGEVYEIISTDNDIHILLTYDNIISKTLNTCGTDEKATLKKTEKNNTPNSSLRVQPCQDNTRVLVLFTPAAQAAVADINQTIDLCISQFNQAVYNSAITTNSYIELAGSQLYNRTETTIVGDLDFIRNDINAQTARNNTNADYVILLTNGSYGTNYGRAATVEPDDANSYAIVQAVAATNENKVFAHEAGHLYGCRHHDDLSGQPYAHGYTFRPNFLGPRYLTLMVGGNETGTRLLNFSNPNVFIDGAPTGTTTNNHNARRVTETFGILRNFRNTPFRPLTASIEGTQTGDECTQGNWEAVVSCGTAPYTYDWEYSYDGFTYYYGASGEFYSATLTCPVGLYQNYYVKLTATSSDFQIATSFLTVYVNRNGDPKYRITGNPKPNVIKQPKYDLKEISAVQKITRNQLSAFPNPAKNTTQIEIQLKETQPVKVEIINSFGQSIKLLFEGNLQAGAHLKNVDVRRLAKGMYMYKLTGKTFSITKKLIIQ